MYDPTIGRWITEDPAGFEAGDDNLYRYVGNKPTMATDPSGLSRLEALSGLNGTQHLYYVGTQFGFWDSDRVFIGTYNPRTGLVVRNQRAVPYQAVRRAAEAWGFGGSPDWNAFFRKTKAKHAPVTWGIANGTSRAQSNSSRNYSVSSRTFAKAS